MTKEEWKEKLDRFNDKFNIYAFEKNGLGWFAVIGFGTVIVIPTVLEWDRVIKSRFVIFVIYFLIGLFLHWLGVPPLREGLRPFEYFLSGIGWPIIHILGYGTMVTLEWWDLHFNHKIKAPWLGIYLITVTMCQPRICKWLADHIWLCQGWLDQYNELRFNEVKTEGDEDETNDGD